MIAINKECACDYSIDSIQPERNVFQSALFGITTSIKNFVKRTKNRSQLTELLYATDSELADIGLRREDLYLIEKAGLFEDPSKELARRATVNRMVRC